MFRKKDIRYFLEITLDEAEKAFEEGNYPIGSLVVDRDGKIISRKRNQCSTNNDITAHTEILNLREVSKLRLSELTMFSSLEPCFGCSFFIARTSIRQIYSALKDPHKGGTSELKLQPQFMRFFSNIKLVNEPFNDLKEKSNDLMKKYFLRLNRKDKAKFYSFK